MQVAAFNSDNRIIPFTGIISTGLTADQKELLISLMYEYVGNMEEGHANVKMDEVKEYLDDTYFTWIDRNNIRNAGMQYTKALRCG